MVSHLLHLLLLAAYLAAAHTLTVQVDLSAADSAKLTCYEDTQIVHNAEWRKDGQPFNVLTDRVQINAGTVVFDPVLPEDEGEYGCGGPPSELIREFR